jgi:phytoene synthase
MPPERGHSHTQPIPSVKTPSAPDTSTFTPGMRLLQGKLRTDVYRLYHILRTLDDLVDEDQSDAPQRVRAVERWALGERVESPETRILAELLQCYKLSPQALLDFCQAMRHDITRAVIQTEGDLELYCQRAGGAVGHMIAQLLGTGPEGEAGMATLGRAVQRTNILRDIDDDVTRGRVYIARTTIERFGSPTPGAREELLRDQIARADALYDDAIGAIPLLSRGQKAVALSAALYREILRQIEREGYGSTPGRVEIPAWRRQLLIAKHRLNRGRGQSAARR